MRKQRSGTLLDFRFSSQIVVRWQVTQLYCLTFFYSHSRKHVCLFLEDFFLDPKRSSCSRCSHWVFNFDSAAKSKELYLELDFLAAVIIAANFAFNFPPLPFVSFSCRILSEMETAESSASFVCAIDVDVGGGVLKRLIPNEKMEDIDGNVKGKLEISWKDTERGTTMPSSSWKIPSLPPPPSSSKSLVAVTVLPVHAADVTLHWRISVSFSLSSIVNNNDLASWLSMFAQTVSWISNRNTVLPIMSATMSQISPLALITIDIGEVSNRQIRFVKSPSFSSCGERRQPCCVNGRISFCNIMTADVRSSPQRRLTRLRQEQAKSISARNVGIRSTWGHLVCKVS